MNIQCGLKVLRFTHFGFAKSSGLQILNHTRSRVLEGFHTRCNNVDSIRNLYITNSLAAVGRHNFTTKNLPIYCQYGLQRAKFLTLHRSSAAQRKSSLNHQKSRTVVVRQGGTRNIVNKQEKDESLPSGDKNNGFSDKNTGDATEQSESLLARFKRTYKQHGKILIGVHLCTSAVWISSFYYVAYSGFDIVPALQWFGVGEKWIEKFTQSGVGYFAIAYLMYKLASPVRYMVTLAGTRFAVGYLRQHGYMKAIPEKNTLRSLFKEGRVKMKDRYGRSKRRKFK